MNFEVNPLPRPGYTIAFSTTWARDRNHETPNEYLLADEQKSSPAYIRVPHVNFGAITWPHALEGRYLYNCPDSGLGIRHLSVRDFYFPSLRWQYEIEGKYEMISYVPQTLVSGFALLVQGGDENKLRSIGYIELDDSTDVAKIVRVQEMYDRRTYSLFPLSDGSLCSAVRSQHNTHLTIWDSELRKKVVENQTTVSSSRCWMSLWNGIVYIYGYTHNNVALMFEWNLAANNIKQIPLNNAPAFGKLLDYHPIVGGTGWSGCHLIRVISANHTTYLMDFDASTRRCTMSKFAVHIKWPLMITDSASHPEFGLMLCELGGCEEPPSSGCPASVYYLRLYRPASLFNAAHFSLLNAGRFHFMAMNSAKKGKLSDAEYKQFVGRFIHHRDECARLPQFLFKRLQISEYFQ